MDGRRARLIDPTLDGVPRIERAPEAAPGAPARHLAPRSLTPGWAAALGFGWPLAFLTVTALEPAPVDPAAPVPLVVELASLVFLAALGMTVVAAAMRQGIAAAAAVVTGVVALAFTISCPISGHHTYGLWWIAELVVLGAMTAVSVAALGRRARTTT
ncbi:MAG TPA: hypothetical protein VK306_05905 [Acidimicrobiales bacterium]|nr:hypothetical protein [Acidimicrobiales bacterium]